MNRCLYSCSVPEWLVNDVFPLSVRLCVCVSAGNDPIWGSQNTGYKCLGGWMQDHWGQLWKPLRHSLCLHELV